MIKLGNRVKDTITGFAGIAVARTEWDYGCVRISVQPEKLDKDGKVRDTETFDEQRLGVIKETRPKVSRVSTAGPGGPRPAPTRAPDPTR